MRQFISESTESKDPVYAEQILVIRGLESYNKSRHSILNATMNAVFSQANRQPFGMTEVPNNVDQHLIKKYTAAEKNILSD